jgi:hypothetical protein
MFDGDGSYAMVQAEGQMIVPRAMSRRRRRRYELLLTMLIPLLLALMTLTR